MRRLSVAFLLRRPYSEGSFSNFPRVMRALADGGEHVDVIAPKGRVIDFSSVRVEHDLYVLKQISGVPLSVAGALHAQGAAIVNPYPATVALRDKATAASILEAAGVPTPATYVAWRPELLAGLLEEGPLVLKPPYGTGGFGVCFVRTQAELAAVPQTEGPILAQRYHPPEGPDLKIYVIGERLFGVKKVFPAITEEEKHGEPFAVTPEQRDIALRCGRAFGVHLYGVDLIQSEGRRYVVDMSSIPGFKGVPDAVAHLTQYFRAAADRAARGEPLGAPSAGVRDMAAPRVTVDLARPSTSGAAR